MRGARAGMVLVLLAPVLGAGQCNEINLTELKRFDYFQQTRRNAVDLLVVIDNSCSMVEEQENLAKNFESLISTFEGADVDWRIAVATTDVEADRYRGRLVGGDDEIVLRGSTGEIDRIEYDRRWPFAAGQALGLDGDKLRFTYNDNHLNWCTSTKEYASGSFGTPGERNPSCATGQPVPTTPGPDDGPKPPVVGNLVITEVMARTTGLDSECEWFELTNTTDDTLDLSGVQLYDLGRNFTLIPDGTQVAPFDALVFGRTAEGCGAPVDVVLGAGFSLMDDIRYIERGTPDAPELFSEMVAQGTGGTGIEMGLEAARLVFSEPFYTQDNQAWLRPEAGLSLLFVADEDDSGPLPVDEYVRGFMALKGQAAYRDHRLMNISGVIAKDPPPRNDLPSCETENGIGWYGRRYLEASNLTGGLVESICEEDFAPIVTSLGLTISGLEVEFGLSEYPDLDTLVVNLYADESAESLIRELVRDVDYTYLFEGNKIRFVEDQVPPSEAYVVAEYEPLPAGAVPGGGQ